MRVIKLCFIFLISLLIVIFALLNSKPVQVSYILGHLELPLSLVLLLSVSLGALVGMIWTASWLMSQRSQVHDLNKRLNLLQKEIDTLRAMPAKDVKQWR